MTKKVINQKGIFDEELINTIEPNFVFKNKPINRFNIVDENINHNQADKSKLLEELFPTLNFLQKSNLL